MIETAENSKRKKQSSIVTPDINVAVDLRYYRKWVECTTGIKFHSNSVRKIKLSKKEQEEKKCAEESAYRIDLASR